MAFVTLPAGWEQVALGLLAAVGPLLFVAAFLQSTARDRVETRRRLAKKNVLYGASGPRDGPSKKSD